MNEIFDRIEMGYYNPPPVPFELEISQHILSKKAIELTDAELSAFVATRAMLTEHYSKSADLEEAFKRDLLILNDIPADDPFGQKMRELAYDFEVDGLSAIALRFEDLLPLWKMYSDAKKGV